jgi:Uma2 family endonuclease
MRINKMPGGTAMNENPGTTFLTTEELLAMPEDGVDRDLIRGQLREKPETLRSPSESEAVVSISYLLIAWLKQQPRPRGQVLCDAGFRIRRDPDTTVGIDVAYISAELAASTPRNAKIVDGVPILAVEILSPSDQHKEVSQKVQEYIDAGVALVWVVDPFFCTVRVHSPEAEPKLFNSQEQLSGEPHLPGFRVAVADIFES